MGKGNDITGNQPFIMRRPGPSKGKSWIGNMRWETSDMSAPPIAFQCNGLWVTGASGSVISTRMATAQGLMDRVFDFADKMGTASGTVTGVPLCAMKSTLIHIHDDKVTNFTTGTLSVAILDLPDGIDALIGMDIIGIGDFRLRYDQFTDESTLTFIPYS